MAEARHYRDLIVWQKGMDLVVEIYRLLKQFPTDEQWGLTSQIRRAAVSVPANIAEGNGRIHRADYVRFLSIARGSLREVETQLQIAVRLEHLPRQEAIQAWDLLQEVGRLLTGLIKTLDNGIVSNGKVSEQSIEYSTDFTGDL